MSRSLSPFTLLLLLLAAGSTAYVVRSSAPLGAPDEQTASWESESSYRRGSLHLPADPSAAAEPLLVESLHAMLGDTLQTFLEARAALQLPTDARLLAGPNDRIEVAEDSERYLVRLSVSEESSVSVAFEDGLLSATIDGVEQLVALPGPVDRGGLATERERSSVVVTLPKAK